MDLYGYMYSIDLLNNLHTERCTQHSSDYEIAGVRLTLLLLENMQHTTAKVTQFIMTKVPLPSTSEKHYCH